MAGRRDLSYASFDEIMPDVDRLLAGHATAGNWTLAQICNHLAATIRASLQPFPADFFPPGTPRASEAGRLHLLRSGRMPEGIPAPEAIRPAEAPDLHAEAESLRNAIRQFRAFSGPYPEHPVLGPLGPDEWERFHCIHCAHHLSFAESVPADREKA